MSFKDFIEEPKRLGRPRVYKTEQERNAARKASALKWRMNNREYAKRYYQEHKK